MITRNTGIRNRQKEPNESKGHGKNGMRKFYETQVIFNSSQLELF